MRTVGAVSFKAIFCTKQIRAKSIYKNQGSCGEQHARIQLGRCGCRHSWARSLLYAITWQLHCVAPVVWTLSTLMNTQPCQQLVAPLHVFTWQGSFVSFFSSISKTARGNHQSRDRVIVCRCASRLRPTGFVLPFIFNILSFFDLFIVSPLQDVCRRAFFNAWLAQKLPRYGYLSL